MELPLAERMLRSLCRKTLKRRGAPDPGNPRYYYSYFFVNTNQNFPPDPPWEVPEELVWVELPPESSSR